MGDVSLDPIALVNAAPATALCVLVYLELRAIRPLIKGMVESLAMMHTALDLLGQLLGVKLRRKTAPEGVRVVRPDED